MKQNMLKSSSTFSIFLLIILMTPPLASALKPSPSDPKAQTEIHKLAARDAITISIQEVRETRKFINSIPRLKSLRLTQQDPMLLHCVERLIFDLSNVKSTLYRLRHLKWTFLLSDSYSLKRMMDSSVRLGKMCGKSLYKHVDEIVLSMLTRKLDDLSIVIDDVVYHVSEIEREEYHGGNCGKTFEKLC